MAGIGQPKLANQLGMMAFHSSLGSAISEEAIADLADRAPLVGSTSAKSRREYSSLDHFLRPAQQLDVELAASKQHIVQRFADIAGFD